MVILPFRSGQVPVPLMFCSFSGITANVYGHCKVRWSVSSGTGNDRRTTVYKSKEDYISLVLILWKGGTIPTDLQCSLIIEGG